MLFLKMKREIGTGWFQDLNAELSEKVIGWRRDFHQFPETGFLEMRTASIVASILDELGFDLSMGKSVMLD